MIREVQKFLQIALMNAVDARSNVESIADSNRLLNEDELHSLQKLALALATEAETVDSYLAQYSRIGIHSKKFAHENN